MGKVTVIVTASHVTASPLRMNTMSRASKKYRKDNKRKQIEASDGSKEPASDKYLWDLCHLTTVAAEPRSLFDQQQQEAAEKDRSRDHHYHDNDC